MCGKMPHRDKIDGKIVFPQITPDNNFKNFDQIVNKFECFYFYLLFYTNGKINN